MSERDTHFTGFADALFYALDWNDINIDMENDGWEDRWKQIIARRAYDLVGHTIESTEHIDLDRLSTGEHITRIPDMPVLPSEPEEQV